MTQGMLTIVDEHGKVLFKIICGCNGGSVLALAKILTKQKVLTLKKLYNIAYKADVGCPTCLVIMNNDDSLYVPEEDTKQKLPQLYRDTFNKPKFNPRWSRGTADYVKILKWEAKHV